MILVALRGLWGRKTRAVLTAISIVLGTAMIAGTFVVRDQITGAFASIFQTGLEKTDVLASKRTASGQKRRLEELNQGTPASRASRAISLASR